MKWILRLALVVVLIAWTTAVWGSEDTANAPSENIVDVAFVVVGVSEDYAEASRVAERAARELGVVLDLRGLVNDPEYGLTLRAEECTDPLYPFPFYLPRGRFDAGEYVSIERSDGYSALRAGYFVVIAASGAPRSAEMTAALAKARRVVPDAYEFREKVYVGCMH